MASEPAGATRAAVEAVFRIESARLIGAVARMVGDVGLAEDIAQEALVTAMERWPSAGIPENPGAWLMATAKNRAKDELRRRRMLDRKHDAIEATFGEEAASAPDLDVAIDENVGDDMLRLMLIASHPVLSVDGRVALTLRLLGGLTTEEIARAFLVPEPTISQRIVRAKRTLTEARVPFELPPAAELQDRIASVLDVVYLVFNEGYTATTGDHWMRPELCDEALRLGRVLVALVPRDAEAHGLVALMEIHASRLKARVGPTGEPVLLLDQDRSRWDQLYLHRGLAALERAEALAKPLGPYALQAAIAGCHARARAAEETDWKRIVALYDALAQITGSPVVELNRAVAVSMAFGPAAGLAIVDELASDPALRSYHHVPSIRGDLLYKLGRLQEARAEFERAASMAKNARERELLLARAKACTG